MKSKTLIRNSKIALAGLFFLGLIVYTQVFPVLGHSITESNPSFASAYLPWLIFIWISGIPWFICLYSGWQIIKTWEQDSFLSFTIARLFKSISNLCLINTFFFTIGNLAFLIFKVVDLLYFFTTLIAVFLGLALSTAAAALSDFAYEAAKTREESELVI